MTDFAPHHAPDSATLANPVSPTPRRGSVFATAIAWLVILACSGYAFVQTNWPFDLIARPSVATQPATAPDPPNAQAVSTAPVSNSHQPDQAYANAARIMLALGDMVAANNSARRQWLLAEAAPLPNAGPGDQLIYVIMAADLVDGAKAVEELTRIETQQAADDTLALSPADHQLQAALRSLYASNTPGSISAEDRALLANELGWFGRFAPLARGVAGESAERTAMLAQSRAAPLIIAGAGLWFLIAGSIGVITLIVLFARALRGTLKHGFELAVGRGGVYAEAFAVFALVFTGVHVLRDLVPDAFEAMPSALATAISIAMQIVGFIGALAWARLRIGDWSLVRRDVGLHAGRGFVREVFAGLLTYCQAIPILIAGALVMFVLLALQKFVWPDAPMPSHPAQEMLKTADWRTAAQIFVLGVIVAPIIEETVFRGMLYQHLRSATFRIGLALSMLVSVAISSLLFASIHPQSWPAIPALAALAAAFCVGREWRGSLIPGIVAHGLSNLVMLTVGFTLFRG